jgi:hypothetical protein
MATTAFRCKLVVCISPANPVLQTHTLFDATYRESPDSPVDEYLKRLASLNQLAPQPLNFNPFQGQLVLLGVIAAVESFIRTLFRRIISLDEISQNKVNDRDVSFGAALHLSKELLPEAILERLSFISEKAIVDALKDILAVKGAMPADLDKAIEDYVRVCQLRHCAVHRFGKLGVSNAINLGLANHKDLLEKPLKLEYASLQDTIAISTCLVKTLNNFLFNEMLSRVQASQWTGSYAQDRELFLRYFNLFRDKVSAVKTESSHLVYRKMMKQRTLWSGGVAGRRPPVI